MVSRRELPANASDTLRVMNAVGHEQNMYPKFEERIQQLVPHPNSLINAFMEDDLRLKLANPPEEITKSENGRSGNQEVTLANGSKIRFEDDPRGSFSEIRDDERKTYIRVQRLNNGSIVPDWMEYMQDGVRMHDVLKWTDNEITGFHKCWKDVDGTVHFTSTAVVNGEIVGINVKVRAGQNEGFGYINGSKMSMQKWYEEMAKSEERSTFVFQGVIGPLVGLDMTFNDITELE